MVPVITHKMTHWSSRTLNKTCFGARDRSVHSEHSAQSICSEDGEDVASQDFRYASVFPWEDGDGHNR